MDARQQLMDGLLANLTGPVTNMMYMVFGIMMFYGIMFFAMRKLQEVFAVSQRNAMMHDHESEMAGIWSLQEAREKRDMYRGTALGDVYSYQYNKQVREYATTQPEEIDEFNDPEYDEFLEQYFPMVEDDDD
jgi:hypothetical protein